MLIPFNVSQGLTEVLISSSSSILADRAEHCDTIGHCRTVWNIIWSCSITIFACIWVAVHPNIPQPKTLSRRAQLKDNAPPGWSRAWVRFHALAFWDNLTDLLIDLSEKLAVSLLALLAPEFIFVWALRQRLTARSIAKECEEAASTERAKEGRRRQRTALQDLARTNQRIELEYLDTLSGSELVGQLGRRRDHLRSLVSASDAEKAQDAERSTRPLLSQAASSNSAPLPGKTPAHMDDNETEWTTAHGFFILMGGFHQFDGDLPGVYLMPNDVIHLVSEGVLIPPSEQEIKDRSKADSFSKLIVLVQTLWFVMQSIARHIGHLAITELEIATLAYTIPILGMYVCWWNKPLGVTQPIHVSKSAWDSTFETDSEHLWNHYFDILVGFDSEHNEPRVPRFSAGNHSGNGVISADIVASIITTLFGAVHCFAWSFHFPSGAEQLLWRIASLVITITPTVWLGLFFSAMAFLFLGDSIGILLIMATPTLIVITIPIYLVARAILLVLAFISLRSLPSAAYETVYWTTFIPHI